MAAITELLRFRSLSLNHETDALPDVIDAIKNTILGNPDGIRYRHLDSMKKIREIKPLQFFTLRKDNSLLYVMALVERITSAGDQYYNSYNVRYVTFNEAFASKSLTVGNHPLFSQRMSNSFFKEGMRKHAESFRFSLNDERTNPEKRLYYAYVEESNLRSMNFTGFFFEPIRKISIITYSHIFPGIDNRFYKLEKEELPIMQKLIRKAYEKHTFFFPDDNDLQQNYYVLKENNIIVAGVKAQVARWKIEQVPGLLGSVLLKILPRIPGFSRIIKPDQFCFLTFDTLYCRPGNESCLPRLLESACATLKVYTGMIYADKDDELYARLDKMKNMGILNKLYKSANGVVLARFVNFSEEEKSVFYNNPVYLSGYDMT